MNDQCHSFMKFVCFYFIPLSKYVCTYARDVLTFDNNAISKQIINNFEIKSFESFIHLKVNDNILIATRHTREANFSIF